MKTRLRLQGHLFLLAVAAMFAVVMVGCRTPQPIVSENTSDRLIEREKVDSLIGVAADSARARIALACDSMGNVYIAEINTLQGERTRLDIALSSALERLQQAQQAQSTNTQGVSSGKPTKPIITYLDVDCDADSLQILVTKLRERITYMEKHKEKETVEVKYVPDYYRNCTRGFWVLFVILLVLFVWWVADYIPVVSKYKFAIKSFFKIVK